MKKHTYASAERFILSREFFGMKLGLENITGFLAEIGTPQTNYPTIHISGTNGKGSTAAMLESMLRVQGYKTGLFTSPHLVSFRERVKVCGRMIPKQSMTAFVDRYRPIITKRKLSFFEVVTALALHHFWKTKVDVAVIETGLGGRLDATNVLSPTLTITTEISRDHVEILGKSLTQIAREKAGIIKRDVPHLIGLLPEPAIEIMKQRCRKIGAPLVRLHKKDFSYEPAKGTLRYSDKMLTLPSIKPALYGNHQAKNGALAVKAVAILREHNLFVSKASVCKGLAETDWRARFEIVKRSGKPTLIFDVGHNVSGVQAFVDAFKSRFPGLRTRIITGFVKRKEHQVMFDHLSQIAADYSLVPLKTKRSSDIRELMTELNWREVTSRRFGSLGTAYRELLKTTDSNDIITVIGSHYLVGEFFTEFNLV